MKNLKVPQHIGIILDGNGRWAKRKRQNRLFGHAQGVIAVKNTIKKALELNIKAISVYAFSTENWKRPKEEVEGIFNILTNAIKDYKQDICLNNIKITTMGDISKLPKKLYNEIEKIKEETKNNDKLIFNIAINYGSKAEILRAVNACIRNYDGEITEKEFERELYSSSLPELDMIIRTSGEKRLSNFMLYQSAYSELFFPKTLWPDFNGKNLVKIIKSFNKRQRRFGNVN